MLPVRRVTIKELWKLLNEERNEKAKAFGAANGGVVANGFVGGGPYGGPYGAPASGPQGGPHSGGQKKAPGRSGKVGVGNGWSR